MVQYIRYSVVCRVGAVLHVPSNIPWNRFYLWNGGLNFQFRRIFCFCFRNISFQGWSFWSSVFFFAMWQPHFIMLWITTDELGFLKFGSRSIPLSSMQAEIIGLVGVEFLSLMAEENWVVCGTAFCWWLYGDYMEKGEAPGKPHFIAVE